jgi:hypothetical protein
MLKNVGGVRLGSPFRSAQSFKLDTKNLVGTAPSRAKVSCQKLGSLRFRRAASKSRAAPAIARRFRRFFQFSDGRAATAGHSRDFWRRSILTFSTLSATSSRVRALII